MSGFVCHANRENVRENLPVFLDILEKQFIGCGEKYAFSSKAEWTDVLCAKTRTWTEETIKKYCGRYKQYAAGKDLIKMATYAFILAIKRGLITEDFGCPVGPNEPLICTTVSMKALHWPRFREMVEGVAGCLIGDRPEVYIPDAMSEFDVVREYDDLVLQSQIIINLMELDYSSVSLQRTIPPVVAFLCFVQWLQDGHHWADKLDDDDPRETKGLKGEVED